MKQEVFTFIGLDVKDIKLQIEHLINEDYTINNVSLVLDGNVYNALVVAARVIHVY